MHNAQDSCRLQHVEPSQAALVAVLQLHVSRPPGDVLVFLCGPVFHCVSIFWYYYEHMNNIRYSNKIIYNYTTFLVVSAWICFHFTRDVANFAMRPGQDDIDSLQRLLEEKQEQLTCRGSSSGWRLIAQLCILRTCWPKRGNGPVSFHVLSNSNRLLQFAQAR